MLRKDLIMRQFEEFGKVLSLILGYKKQNDWEKFEMEISKAFEKFTSLDIHLIENLSEQDFKNEIISTTKLSFEQKKIIASLLFEKMNYYLEKTDPEKHKNLKLQCLSLYTHLNENLTHNEFDMDVYYKLEFLKKL